MLLDFFCEKSLEQCLPPTFKCWKFFCEKSVSASVAENYNEFKVQGNVVKTSRLCMTTCGKDLLEIFKD